MDYQILKNLSLFNDLLEGDLKACFEAASKVSIKKDAYFFRQEDPASQAYVLVKGRVKLSQLTPDGQQIVLRIAAPVQVFAIVAALPDRLYPVSAQAIDDCVTLAWAHSALVELGQRFPAIMTNTLQMMSNNLQDFQDLYRHLATEKVDQRLARVLLRLHKQVGVQTSEGQLIDLPLTRQGLAEMCGTTLYTVSRILSAWEDEGVVHSGREKVILKDLEALKDLSGG